MQQSAPFAAKRRRLGCHRNRSLLLCAVIVVAQHGIQKPHQKGQQLISMLAFNDISVRKRLRLLIVLLALVLAAGGCKSSPPQKTKLVVWGPQSLDRISGKGCRNRGIRTQASGYRSDYAVDGRGRNGSPKAHDRNRGQSPAGPDRPGKVHRRRLGVQRRVHASG